MKFPGQQSQRFLVASIVSVVNLLLSKIYTLLLKYLDLMGWITSSGCAWNDQITCHEVQCDPVVPGAATRHDPTHQIKLLK